MTKESKVPKDHGILKLNVHKNRNNVFHTIFMPYTKAINCTHFFENTKIPFKFFLTFKLVNEPDISINKLCYTFHILDYML